MSKYKDYLIDFNTISNNIINESLDKIYSNYVHPKSEEEILTVSDEIVENEEDIEGDIEEHQDRTEDYQRSQEDINTYNIIEDR